MTVGELCGFCRNWFPRARLRGHFTIRGGELDPLPGASEGQYIRILGSMKSDGVYRLPAADLCDEEFDGAVWLMAPPQDFITLAEEIDAWERDGREAMRRALNTPYRAESFEGYSRTSADSETLPADWRDERLGFMEKVGMYRKM